MATTASLDPTSVANLGARLRDNVTSVLKVPEHSVTVLLVALLAEGHVLIEDVPGVGKTALARALARSITAESARVQCTADLLPTDIVGTNVFDQRIAQFGFRPGPVFSNILLVDEINRASPRTQSGLFECMQERQVTIDGVRHELPRPFIVVATQNPVDFEGTYPLPEAELDRFMVRLSLGYPDETAIAELLAEHAQGDPVAELAPVADLALVRAAQATVSGVHGSEVLRRYVAALAEATRADSRVLLGASPRAALMLYRGAMAHAALAGRDHVLPDDVQDLADSVLSHRLVLSYDVDPDQRETVIRDAVERVPAR